MNLTEVQAETVLGMISYLDNDGGGASEDQLLLAKEIANAYPKLGVEYAKLIATADQGIEFARKQAEKNLAHMALIQEGIDRRKRNV